MVTLDVDMEEGDTLDITLDDDMEIDLDIYLPDAHRIGSRVDMSHRMTRGDSDVPANGLERLLRDGLRRQAGKVREHFKHVPFASCLAVHYTNDLTHS